MYSFTILVVLFFNILSSGSVILPNYSKNTSTLIDEILIVLLEECNLGLKNIIFYETIHSDLTRVPLIIKAPADLRSWILKSSLDDVELGDPLIINGFVVVFNSNEEWKQLIDIIIYSWQCSKTCTVIFLSKEPNSCQHAMRTLSIMGYAHFDIVYYVCVDDLNGPVIYTQDPVGDSQPSKWQKYDYSILSSNPWSIYYRTLNADICQNFNIYRTNPKNGTRIMVGVIQYVSSKSKIRPDYVHKGDIAGISPNSRRLTENMRNLERLLKTKFIFYVKPILFDDDMRAVIQFFWQFTPCDTFTNGMVMLENSSHYEFSYPSRQDEYVILSHNQGLASPLEKIAQFYGIWTLLSLIAILSMTFIVIYLKTNRNIVSAAFDVLRLLINSGIETPINTLPLKIFFSMIFLYFVVIHSTFSGNLPKFLTIPVLRDRIDTIEDLAKPRVLRIYKSGYRYVDENGMKVIEKKTIISNSMQSCYSKFLEDPNAACIMSSPNAYISINSTKVQNKVYVSKNNFGSVLWANVFRHRFIFREEFNWAITYLTEIGIFNYHFQVVIDQIVTSFQKEQVLARIDFRPISINDLQFAFIFLSIGIILGLICFFIELLISQKYSQRVNLRHSRAIRVVKLKKNNQNIRRILVKPQNMTL